MTAEEVQRDKWGGKIDFILSCLGYAVGLGNVWRFPYLCGRSGGAAFLIPYFIMMIFAGFPVFYMELAIGQFAGLTPKLLYRRMCPVFTGIGYSMIIISLFTGIYYNMIIAWSMYYFGVSFTTSTLPWEGCTNWWNTINCTDTVVLDGCKIFNESAPLYYKGECRNVTEETWDRTENFTSLADQLYYINLTFYNEEKNTTTNKTIKSLSTESPASEYLNRRVLKLSDGLHDMGTPSWELVVCLAVAWVLVFLCLIKGIKSSGKVVYFTATFPYVILLILLILGVTLEGAGDGVLFYLVPDWSKLKEASVWGDAAVQIFFSLSLGGGGLTTLASYNEFHNNLLRDTLIVVLGNCGTSLFAGFVIFPIIGFVAKKTGRPVADVAAQGSGLAFIAYPDALVRLPAAPFWAILFFFMLIILGIDSQLVIVEVVITCILDQWPALRKWQWKILVVAGVCAFSFLLGIILTCPGGPYVLDLVDTFAGGWPLVMACLAEVCMVSWCYGIRRFIDDIRMMLGAPPNAFWKVLGYPVNIYWIANWLVLTPILLIFVLLFNWADYKGITKGDYVYPVGAEAAGWLLAIFCVIWIPIFAIYYIVKAQTEKRGWRWLVNPSPEWAPNDDSFKPQQSNAYPMGGYGNPGFSGPKPGEGPPIYPAQMPYDPKRY